MSLRYALLALLTTGPKHGYELKNGFEETFSGMWDVNAGQIYTTLARLLRDGLVIHERIEQDDRPDKKVYTLTETGHEEVNGWMDNPTEDMESPKDDLLVKLFLLRRLSPETGRLVIHQERKKQMQFLRQLVLFKSETRDEVKKAILDRTILRLEADLKWLEICADTLFDA